MDPKLWLMGWLRELPKGIDLRSAGIAAGAGIVVGFIAAHFQFSLITNLLLWGLGGMSIGYFGRSVKEVIQTGAVYGFFLTPTFLLLSFGASFSKFFSLIALLLALAVIGMIGGVISTVVGNLLKPYLMLEPIKKYF
jgi:hypothetical protein